MYIKIHNKKINIRHCVSFNDKFKSLRFVLEPIDYGILIPKKKFVNTYMFCQRVDVCLTDKDDRIVALYENLKSEKSQTKEWNISSKNEKNYCRKNREIGN